MMDQARQGDAQMEGSMANALLEEWAEQQQFNRSDTIVLQAEFTNV